MLQPGKGSVDARKKLMEFRVLGPLEVLQKGRVLDIGAGKRRTLLAVLLLHANEVVSSDRLIDELWDVHAPATAPKILQGYVSQLRKMLADDAGGDESADGGGVLLTRPPGYVLRLEDGQLDADHFADLLARGRVASRLRRGALLSGAVNRVVLLAQGEGAT